MVEIGISIVYLALSIFLIYISNKINSIDLISRRKNKKKDIIRGKKYLDILIDQLNKTINENKEKKTFSNILDYLPDYDVSKSSFPFFSIIYASQSNTSKKFAEKIYDDATTYLNIKCQIKNISEITIEDFNKNIFLVFFLSTYGEGGPTDDGIEFNKKLEEKFKGKFLFFENFTNKNLLYTIFGLGSSKYENFNEISKKFDEIFQKQGLKKICQNGTGDDAGNINYDFENWRKLFWNNCHEYFKKNSEDIKNISQDLNLRDLYEGMGKEIEIILVGEKKQNEIDLNDYDFSTKRFLNSGECVIEDIRELRKENINGSTLKVTYSMENSSLKYQVGDNIGVFPTNNDSYVSYIINRLGYDPELYVYLKKLKSIKKKVAIPEGYSIKELLINVIDLNCHVNIEILEKFLKYCYDEDQYEELQTIIKRDSKRNEYLAKKYNIVDFLTNYDSINLEFLDFYNIMPKIIPRFYTVASSPNYMKDKFEIVISLLEWKGTGNQSRYGLTSSYFKTIHENLKLGRNSTNFKSKIIIRESSFKIPKDHSQNLLMICNGTGIAPFISFLQEFFYLSKSNCKINNTILLFGSKNRKYDFIYEENINLFQEKNILKRFYATFSRDQEKKNYVQDIIKENKTDFENLILEGKSTIFICGGVSMGNDVTLALESLFTKEYIKKLEIDGKLIKELWE